MKTTMLARAAVGALALATIAGCNQKSSFTLSETFEINGTGSDDSTMNVNLADIAGNAWDQRKHVKDATITSAVGYIRKVYADDDATQATGYATIARPSGTPVTAAEATSASPVAISTTAWLAAKDLDGTAAVIKDALKGDGALTLVTHADATGGTGHVHIDVEVVIDVEVSWSLF